MGFKPDAPSAVMGFMPGQVGEREPLQPAQAGQHVRGRGEELFPALDGSEHVFNLIRILRQSAGLCCQTGQRRFLHCGLQPPFTAPSAEKQRAIAPALPATFAPRSDNPPARLETLDVPTQADAGLQSGIPLRCQQCIGVGSPEGVQFRVGLRRTAEPMTQYIKDVAAQVIQNATVDRIEKIWRSRQCVKISPGVL